MLIKVDKLIYKSKSSKKKKTYHKIHTLNNEVFEEKNYNKNIYRGLKLWITLFSFNFLFFNYMNAQETFFEEQILYPRVVDAFNSKTVSLKQEFIELGLTWPVQEIYIRSFKSEQELEIWVKEDETFKLFKIYNVCKSSGQLGPKLKQGDGQVPEGLYYIDRFNPKSSFWLSLGINYPNKADLIRTTAADPGGDIFIHGDCVTIGCLPMTNDIMKEIYVLAVLSKSNSNNIIPVHIFPYRFGELNNIIYNTLYEGKKEFWNSLESEYQHFNQTNILRDYYINDKGSYIFID